MEVLPFDISETLCTKISLDLWAKFPKNKSQQVHDSILECVLQIGLFQNSWWWKKCEVSGNYCLPLSAILCNLLGWLSCTVTQLVKRTRRGLLKLPSLRIQVLIFLQTLILMFSIIMRRPWQPWWEKTKVKIFGSVPSVIIRPRENSVSMSMLSQSMSFIKDMIATYVVRPVQARMLSECTKRGNIRNKVESNMKIFNYIRWIFFLIFSIIKTFSTY